MKKIVAVLLVAISLLFSINFAFADSVPLSSTQWVLPSNGFGGGSRANPVDTVLPYSDMASLLSSVNSGLKSGAYSGFTGKARISYTGSFYFITLVMDGDTYWLCNGSGGRYRTEPENITTDSTTTTPSTNAPTTTPSTTEAGNGANGTYIPTHSAASNDTGLLRQIAQYTHEIWFWADLINDNLRDVRRYLFMVYSNVGRFVDGMNNITKGIYRQIDLLSGYLPRLDDIYNRLFQIQSAAWASVDVENRLLYSLEGLASNISGVIVDGAVKVTSSPDPAVAEAITGIQNTLTSVISNGKVLVDNSDVVSALYTDFASVMGILESVDTGSLDPTVKFPALTGLIAVSTGTYELVHRIGFGIDDVVSAIQSIPAFDDTDIITAIQSIPAYDDSALVSAVTTISDQITEQFGEYDSTYSFPNFSSSGQSAANNKTVSGVLPSAFTSINPGTRQLLYSPSGTLILPKRVLYNGGGDCKNVYCTPYIHQTYGLGYRLEFLFRFSRIQNTPRTETVQFPSSQLHGLQRQISYPVCAFRLRPCSFLFSLCLCVPLLLPPLGRFRQLAGLVWSE